MENTAIHKLIIGAGRQAAETYYFNRSQENHSDNIAFAVDEPGEDKTFLGKPVFAIDDIITHYRYEAVKPGIIVAIGEVSVNRKLSEKFKKEGFPFFNVINKSVQPERDITIGKGVTIAEGTILTCNILIGDHVLINIGCTISHDCIIEDYVNISPGCHLAGRVHIEEGVFVGTGASFIPRVRVGKNSIIAAGACVTKDIPAGCMAAGVPATVRKYLL